MKSEENHMNFVPLTIGEKEFKLRLDLKNTQALEKVVGTNPVNVLLGVAEGKMPSASFTAACLHASMQKFHNGMTMTKVNDLLDEAIDQGMSITDFMEPLMDVFQVSGLIPKNAEETDEEVKDQDPEQ